MTVLLRVFVIATFAAIGGCASSPGGGGGSSSTSAQAPAARIAAPVRVPAASRQKVVLTMEGPKAIMDSKDWPEFKREWRETFAEHAKDAGVAFTFVDGNAKPTGEDGTLLVVRVQDFRIVGIGTRIMLGIMTGNAFIDANVKFLNLRNGTAFGEQQYNTTSSAGAGIFAKMTPQQVDAIASNVFLDLKTAR